jgi:hypothetical protein
MAKNILYWRSSEWIEVVELYIYCGRQIRSSSAVTTGALEENVWSMKFPRENVASDVKSSLLMEILLPNKIVNPLAL